MRGLSGRQVRGLSGSLDGPESPVCAHSWAQKVSRYGEDRELDSPVISAAMNVAQSRAQLDTCRTEEEQSMLRTGELPGYPNLCHAPQDCRKPL